MEIVHDGWLLKSPPPKRLWRAKWRNRWFVLRSGDLPGQYFLEYYTDDTMKKLKGKIDLDQCEQVDAGITFAQRKFDYKFMFDIKTPKRVYYLCTETEEQMNRWVDCVCQVCGLKVMSPEDQYDPMAQQPLTYDPSLRSATEFPLPVDSPPPSASSIISGPYIPISECITGKKNSVGGTRFPFPSDPTTENQRIPSEMAPSAPLFYQNTGRGGIFYQNTNTNRSLKPPRESYDVPRTLRPSATSDESSSVQSPLSTESSTLFSDEPQTPSLRESGNESTASSAGVHKKDSKSHKDLESPPSYQAPPRPPKPPHLAVEATAQQSYMNLDTIMKNSRRNSAEERAKNGASVLQVPESSVSSSDTENIQPSPKEITDEMYDFPRSHHADSVAPNSTIERTRRHCYNNAAPTSIGRFSNEKEVNGDKETTMGNYANLGTCSSAPPPPPAVDRGTRPKPPSKKPSVEGSTSVLVNELSPPPSGGTVSDTSLGAVGGGPLSSTSGTMPIPPASAPPIVDRHRRKPIKKISESALLGASAAIGPMGPNPANFVLEPVPRSKQRLEPMCNSIEPKKQPRAAPSPTPPSHRNGRINESDTDADSLSSHGSRRDSTGDEKVFFPLDLVQTRRPSHHEIQYLDLDLEVPTPLPQGSPKIISKTSAAKVVPSESSIVYKKVDFVKTEAFNKMRQIVDEGYRKYQE